MEAAGEAAGEAAELDTCFSHLVWFRMEHYEGVSINAPPYPPTSEASLCVELEWNWEANIYNGSPHEQDSNPGLYHKGIPLSYANDGWQWFLVLNKTRLRHELNYTCNGSTMDWYDEKCICNYANPGIAELLGVGYRQCSGWHHGYRDPWENVNTNELGTLESGLIKEFLRSTVKIHAA